MEKNVGHFDRIARLALGPVLLTVGALGATGTLAVGSAAGRAALVGALLLGAMFLVTGTTKRCLVNKALGIDTYRGDTEAEGGWIRFRE